MGNFYVTYTIQSSNSNAVVEALAGRRAFVTSVPGQPVVAFDEAADSQDQEEITNLGRHLSTAIDSPVLAVLNHDDDILWYCLFIAGACADEYDSSPDYFEEEGEPRGPAGGDAARLCEAFGSTNVQEIETILRNNDYAFAYERHEDLARALGIPSFGVASSFAYISQGELPQGVSREHLVEIA